MRQDPTDSLVVCLIEFEYLLLKSVSIRIWWDQNVFHRFLSLIFKTLFSVFMREI